MLYTNSMRHNVYVHIPLDEGKHSYRLFAQGFLIETPQENKEESIIIFKFLGGTVFALFYYFNNFRRAYLATEWQDENDGESVKLPGIDVPLYVLYKARGRKVDELKHAINILATSDYSPFELPIKFWVMLANQIDLYGSHKEEVLYIYNMFMKRNEK